jgi:hypothetical protein
MIDILLQIRINSSAATRAVAISMSTLSSRLEPGPSSGQLLVRFGRTCRRTGSTIVLAASLAYDRGVCTAPTDRQSISRQRGLCRRPPTTGDMFRASHRAEEQHRTDADELCPSMQVPPSLIPVDSLGTGCLRSQYAVKAGDCARADCLWPLCLWPLGAPLVTRSRRFDHESSGSCAVPVPPSLVRDREQARRISALQPLLPGPASWG